VKENYTVFDSTPTTYILTAGFDDKEQFEFLKRFKEIKHRNFLKEKLPAKHCE
jgi:hypothetical protein